MDKLVWQALCDHCGRWVVADVLADIQVWIDSHRLGSGVAPAACSAPMRPGPGGHDRRGYRIRLIGVQLSLLDAPTFPGTALYPVEEIDVLGMRPDL